MAAVAITRTDLTAAQLRRAATRTADAHAARRIDRQTLRDWVHRYNAEGVAGLSNRSAPGAQPRLSAEQMLEVAELVRQGPSLAEHGVVRWRRIDLSRVIAQRYGVALAERSVGELLRRLGFRRMSVRPRCPEQDGAAQEAHKKTFPTWSQPASRRTRAASQSNCGGRTKPASASKAR